MRNLYIENLKVRFFQDADRTNACADEKDINRNHTNYGGASAIAQVLIDFGCKVNLPVWEDNNKCLRIPFIQVDDWRIDFNNGR